MKKKGNNERKKNVFLSSVKCFENVLYTTINYDFQIFYIYIMSNKEEFEFLPREFNFYNTHGRRNNKKKYKKTRRKKYISHKLFRCLKIMQEVVKNF